MEIYFTEDYWKISEEEIYKMKLVRMKRDKFIKEYPLFSNIDDIITLVKSGVKIYNNDIMREIALCDLSHL